MTVYSDSAEKASQVARSAIPLATKLGLPINPHVYAVCYEYTAKLNTRLTKAFEALLEEDAKPDKYMVELLYQQYIEESNDQAIEILKQAIQNLVLNAEGTLKQAEDHTAAYGHSLEEASEGLEKEANSPESIKAVVQNLIEGTSQMRESTHNLQEQLAAARREVEEMHKEYENIREQAYTDPLTGLKNRRAFDETLELLFADHKEKDKELTLLVIDIDHFKKVNDNYGHAVGDAVLKCVGKIVKNCVRGDDIAARFGGEEFALLLPNTPKEGAVKVAEKIRKVIAAQKFRHKDQELEPTTISIGLATSAVAENQMELFEQADAALYAAKSGGRNQVRAA